ncbi:MAG: thioredoxin domain-containing protein, partial [Rhodobacteraceae bacterium]|nr:thioredoxin domain-containing protein [Paracoccaceae bacterium]
MNRFLPFFIAFLASITLAEAREANHLLGARSPYLLQHLYNPVDWYPWGPEALERARAENKPIFISVGYSSCHWCHVMEEESFENEAIAALLNEHFVSIKIDRESRPDLDEQFMIVTQVLAGGGGWPNSVFLTPEGDPFHAGGYMPPETFMADLFQVRQAWNQDPGLIGAEAAKVTQAVSSYLTRRAEAREITPDVVRAVAESLLPEMDPFNGGFGVAPKFPREALFLFLLDQAGRTGDRWLLQTVTDMLDGMIKGGIHDHVGGGFHRYAVDPEWHLPHFEKMLFTQAMTGRLLVRAWGITGEPRYRRAAERLFDYVLRELRDPGGGFYSSQDADSINSAGEKVEGARYMWTPAELDPLGEDAPLVRDIFQVTEEGDLEGANVLNLAALPKDTAAETGYDADAFTARLDTVLKKMHRLRSVRQAPFLDRKIVVDWNAAMIETLAEAAYRLERPDYRRTAEDAARFILDQMREPEGLNRVWFEGAAAVPAQLSDYAALALALVALHDYAPDKTAATGWLVEALATAGELQARFGAPDNGFRMTETVEGLSDIIPLDDGDIPSANALALTLFARLSHRAQVPEIEQNGFSLAAALSGHALAVPEQRGFALKAIQDLQEGETGPVRYAAKGAVRAELIHDRSTGEVAIALLISDGWHINAHEPLEDYFIATSLTVSRHADLAVEYPVPVVKALSFNDKP